MEHKRDISSYFEGVLANINVILNNSFYKDIDKENLIYIETEVEKWYETYKKRKSLKEIEVKILDDISLEIAGFFDKYVALEPVKENYAERLSYDFGHLEICWKKEMLVENDK